MDDPRYGTHEPDSIPVINLANGVTARLLSGSVQDATGPFKTAAEMQMMDIVYQSY